MPGIEENFASTMQGLRPQATLVAAVSGGMDSMALLQLLARSGERIVVAHFNHHLRGPESDADQEFVRDQAWRKGLKFRTAAGDVRAAAKGISIEMAARELRHRFLAEVAREESAALVLAHHADDQIELFIMRLLRGVEGPALAGMKMESRSPADPTIRMLRPLLGATRREIAAFVAQHNIPFREDSTNVELHADRNRIRHLIIPALRAEGGEGFEQRMLNQIEAIRLHAERAREAARAWLTKGRDFGALPEWLQREVLAAQLHERAIPITGRLLHELMERTGELVTIKPGQRVARDEHGRLQFFGQLWPANSVEIDLTKEFRAEFDSVEISWKFLQTATLEPRQNEIVFDADRLGKKIILRHWQKGDRIRLSGRASTRHLHEMFSRNKIPRDQRHLAIVAATAAGEIFWVEGLRITERFKVTSKTTRFLQWRWRRQ